MYKMAFSIYDIVDNQFENKYKQCFSQINSRLQPIQPSGQNYIMAKVTKEYDFQFI